MKIVLMIKKMMIFSLFKLVVFVFSVKQNLFKEKPVDLAKFTKNMNDYIDKNFPNLSNFPKLDKKDKKSLYLNGLSNESFDRNKHNPNINNYPSKNEKNQNFKKNNKTQYVQENNKKQINSSHNNYTINTETNKKNISNLIENKDSDRVQSNDSRSNFEKNNQTNKNDFDNAKELPLNENQLKSLDDVSKIIRKDSEKSVKNEIERKKLNFFPYKKIDHNIYLEMIHQTVSNANSKQSVPFIQILNKIKNFFNQTEFQKMEEEIKRLRQLDIGEVSKEIISFSKKIMDSSDELIYWYYYYITANVVLKGQLKIKENREITKEWKMSTNTKSILKKGEDKYYDELVLKEKGYIEILKDIRVLTINEIRNSTYRKKSIIDSSIDKYRRKIYKYHHILKEYPTLREWIGDLNRTHIELRDFKPNIYLFDTIKNTSLFQYLNLFPKGVIHHLHFSAAFNLNDIMASIEHLILANFKKNKITVFIKAEVFLEDKTRPNNYNDIPSPRIFIIEDFINFLNSFRNITIRRDLVTFKENYVLGDGRCIISPVMKEKQIKPEMKAFLYLQKCKNSKIYSKSFDSKSDIKFIEKKRVGNFEDLVIFLKNESHILEEEINLQNDFLPNSYRDLLYTVKDQLSVAVWFKFESIFGIYSELFNNTNVFKTLSDILKKDLLDDNVFGVEYRQGYDMGMEDSRMEILKNISDSKNKKIPTSFIIPGRKLIKSHKLRDLIKNLDTAKKNKNEHIVGFDFFGYEDDPFTGARNFFPISIKKIFEEKDENASLKPSLNNNESDKDNNDFAFMLNALRNGSKLYLHAGETMYFPNYPISKRFLKQFYINDNLIHAILLPNVARVGHGFAVNNNQLLMNIYKMKEISLEICPTSNQALQYYDVWESPIVNLLRKGLSVTVSPDDPGLFFYSGVRMDWFNLIMHTDLKPSEYYLLVRNSIFKSSIKEILDKKEEYLVKTKKKLENFFKKLKFFLKDYDKKKLMEAILITEEQKKRRLLMNNERKNGFKDKVKRNANKIIKPSINPYLNIYDINNLLEHREEYSDKIYNTNN